VYQTPPLFSITAFPFQPYGQENHAGFLAPDMHAGKLREIGAQCPPLLLGLQSGMVHIGQPELRSNPTKNNFEFFAYLARGARILPCFNGIMGIPLDMIMWPVAQLCTGIAEPHGKPPP
jgi:hypothetical protein